MRREAASPYLIDTGGPKMLVAGATMVAAEHLVDSNKSLCRRRTGQAPETFVSPHSHKAVEIPLKVRCR